LIAKASANADRASTTCSRACERIGAATDPGNQGLIDRIAAHIDNAPHHSLRGCSCHGFGPEIVGPCGGCANAGNGVKTMPDTLTVSVYRDGGSNGRSVHRIETQAPGVGPEAGAVITMIIAPGYSRDTVTQAVQFLWGAVMNDDARFGEIRGE
jgi:hypothetical protein